MPPKGPKGSDRPLFADPKMDLSFKKIFGTLANKSLLIDLLNTLLRLPEAARILDIEYLSPEQLPPRDGLKVGAEIAAQTDPAILAAWLARCATARSAEEAVA